MKVLVACEFSGIVRDAFIRRGHNAMSCDLLPTEKPGPHHKGDVLPLLRKSWDLIIAHPECTYITNSGVGWLSSRCERWKMLWSACEFFRECLNANAPKIATENPIPHKYALRWIGTDYAQLIQPFKFGHPESKATCLWLKNLPALKPTKILSLPKCGHWENQTPSGQNKLGPSPTRSKDRARTYQGIAEAMADQWSIS